MNKRECDSRQFFDAIADQWDRSHCPPEDQVRLDKILAGFGLRNGDWVLDAGCGTGRLLPLIRDRIGPNGRLLELDHSWEMLIRGQRKTAECQVWFVQGDAQAIPLADRLFDAVVAFALFPHVENKELALMEFRRVLKPGSPLFILHLLGRRQMNLLHAGMSDPVSSDRIPSEAEMERLFSMSGFSRLTIQDQPDLYLAMALA